MEENSERKELSALHIDDLREALMNMGLLERFYREELKCTFCGRILNLENLGTISYRDDEVILTCDDDVCIKQAYLRGEKHD